MIFFFYFFFLIKQVLDYMKKAQNELSNIQNDFINAYRVYETELLLGQKIKNPSNIEKE